MGFFGNFVHIHMYMHVYMLFNSITRVLMRKRVTVPKENQLAESGKLLSI